VPARISISLPSLSSIVKSRPTVLEPSRRNENHVRSNLCRRLSVKRQEPSILNTLLVASNTRRSSTLTVRPNPEPRLMSVLLFAIKYPRFTLNFSYGVSWEAGFSANAGWIKNNTPATKNTYKYLLLINMTFLLSSSTHRFLFSHTGYLMRDC
jgi:hypothetical protein